MCIACREMQDKRNMLRIVKNAEGEISLDKTGKKAGRGAYICPKKECFEKLKKYKLINKAFSSPVNDELYDEIMEEFLGNKE